VFLVVFLDGITLRHDKPPVRATARGPLTVAAVHGGVGGTEAPEYLYRASRSLHLPM